MCLSIVSSHDYLAAFLSDESENFVCLGLIDRFFRSNDGQQCSMRVLPIINEHWCGHSIRNVVTRVPILNILSLETISHIGQLAQAIRIVSRVI